MTPKGNKKFIIVTVAIMAFLLAYYMALHYTRVDSILHGNAQPIGQEEMQMLQGVGKDNTLSKFMTAIIIGGTFPWHINGMRPLMAFIPAAGMLALIAFIGVGLELKIRTSTSSAPGEESGSAKWNNNIKGYLKKFTTPYTKEDIEAGYSDPNIILAKGLELSLTGKGIDIENKRNAHVMVMGGSGTGKSFSIIKPNILQFHSSFIVTDPSAELLRSTAKALLSKGYNVKVFSTTDMKHSNTYNPLDYIYDVNGDFSAVKVRVLVDTFIKNIDPDKKGGDPFWDKAASSIMTACIGYLAEFCNPEDRNMYNILRLIQAGKMDEDSSSSETKLDKMFEDARRIDSKAKCFISYDTFKLAPAKTANSVLITLGVDLEPFGSADEVRNLTTSSYLCRRNDRGQIIDYIMDENEDLIKDSSNIDLNKLGCEKTALFVVIPQAEKAFQWLVSLMYAQCFAQLYDIGEHVCPVRWNIVGADNIATTSLYKTQEEAEAVRQAFANATVISEEENGETFYYIYNKDADDSLTIPEKRVLPVSERKGFLKQVYSKEVGEYIIRMNRDGKVVHNDKNSMPIPIRMLLDEFANSATRSLLKTA